MGRKIRLYDYRARQVAASCATSDLRQQRREALRRAEIRAVQRVVGAENADQRKPRKVVALREHLRADQQIDRMLGNLRSHRRKRVLRARAVAINANDPSSRERLRQRAFESLGAKALGQEIDIAAVRTRRRQRLQMAAMMAAHRRRIAMHGQTGAAPWTFRWPSASRALQRRCKAATIYKYQ